MSKPGFFRRESLNGTCSTPDRERRADEALLEVPLWPCRRSIALLQAPNATEVSPTNSEQSPCSLLHISRPMDRRVQCAPPDIADTATIRAASPSWR